MGLLEVDLAESPAPNVRFHVEILWKRDNECSIEYKIKEYKKPDPYCVVSSNNWVGVGCLWMTGYLHLCGCVGGMGEGKFKCRHFGCMMVWCGCMWMWVVFRVHLFCVLWLFSGPWSRVLKEKPRNIRNKSPQYPYPPPGKCPPPPCHWPPGETGNYGHFFER